MRAVTGEVTSSNPISLSKAAAVINRFASSETGARPDVAAYLNRAAIAFNELVAVHREIHVQRKIFHVEEKEGATHDENNNPSGQEKKKNKKKKKKGSYFEEEAGNSILELQGEMGVSRKKRKHSDFEQLEVNGEMKHEEGKRKNKRRTIE